MWIVRRSSGRRLLRLFGTSGYCGAPERPMDELEKNPFYNKYADKLKHLKEDSPETFDSGLASVVAEHEKKKEQRRQAAKEQRAQLLEAASQVKAKGLDAVMKLDLVKDKTAEEIEQIWKEFHKDKDQLFAIIPDAEYAQIYERGRTFSTFLYPLPRASGYEFFIQQIDGHFVHFTPLIQYQAHKENAPACLILRHYVDLMDDKGIVLMSGEPNLDVLSIYESQLLAMQFKLYYGTHAGLRYNLVRQFNTSPQSFRHMDLVREFQRYLDDDRAARLDRK